MTVTTTRWRNRLCKAKLNVKAGITARTPKTYTRHNLLDMFTTESKSDDH